MLFLLTTNRAEVLEPALAGRPGRVDQAIEIGLPEDAERRTLLQRYSRGLNLPAESVPVLSRRIGKVTPAFIKELCRRAAQEMLERGGQALEEGDFERCVRELKQRPRNQSVAREAVGFVG